jgi:hypothetical protein
MPPEERRKEVSEKFLQMSFSSVFSLPYEIEFLCNNRHSDNIGNFSIVSIYQKCAILVKMRLAPDQPEPPL